MRFGLVLARLRRERGWSQEELALRAGLSQRHLSFLETGRSRPGQKGLAKLGAALGLKGWEQRALFEALMPAVSKPGHQALDKGLVTDLLARFSQWPGYAFSRDGTLIGCNAALNALLALAAPGENLWAATTPATGPNIYDLVFHPAGLIRWLANPCEVIPETRRRLAVEAAQDASLLPVLARIDAYPALAMHRSTGAAPPPVLIERYRIAGDTLAIIAVLSHLASPGELTLDQLRFESFVPADDASRRLLVGLSV